MRSRRASATIGEALAENGKVVVTGCLGAKAGEGGGNLVRQMHPSVLAVTGPHATEEVMDAVHAHVPKPHDPFVDLVPAPPSIGIKLTPKHYAYLKISEGCNHRCTFCIIPSLRGDLVSRPVGDVLARGGGAVRIGRQGTAGDQPGHERLRRRRPLSHRLLGRPAGEDAAPRAVRAAGRDRRAARRLGAAALRLPVSARRRDPAADGDRRGSCPTSTCRSSIRIPTCCGA